MVKLLLTEALVGRIATTFNWLQESSVDSLPSRAQHTLKMIAASSRSPEGEQEDDLQSIEGHHWIDHSTLLLLSNVAKHQAHQSHLRGALSESKSIPSFYGLLKSSQLYFKPKTPREKSIELQKILEKIRLEQDQESYERMISIGPVSQHGDLGLNFFRRGASSSSSSSEKKQLECERNEWNQVRKSITLILNILFSVLGTIIAVFWLLNVSYTYPFDISLLVSLGLGAFIFSVELILYWNYL